MALQHSRGYCALMSTTQNLVALGKLIAAHHGWPVAKAFKAYQMDDAAGAKVSAAALDILKAFPPLPAASALMSAAFAVRLEKTLNAPIQVVAGTLSVNDEPVFGDQTPFPIGTFAQAGGSWNGHVWVMIGPYVADISLFRTAYSRFGPAALSRHVDLTFGPNKGLYVDHWGKTRQRGLKYEPSYVLSRDEVDHQMASAYHTIRQHAANA